MEPNEYTYFILSLSYELPEDGTDVPKHVGAGKDYVVCAFVWFCKLTFFFVISYQDEELRAQYHCLLTTAFLWLH
jgi:hypothetical protein